LELSVDKIDSAVILAGGAGLRLRPLTTDMPKAMIPIAGKPLLQWIIEWLKVNEVSNVIIGVAYKKEKVMDYFGNGSKLGVDIKYSVHSVEGGTSEGFRLAIERHVADDNFLAMNGDELVDVNVQKFFAHHVGFQGLATIAVAPLRSPYGVVEIEGNDIVGFQEKPVLASHFVSIGTYIFARDVLPFLPQTGDVERTLFPRLSSMRKLKVYRHDGFWATVNTSKDLEDVENQLRKRVS